MSYMWDEMFELTASTSASWFLSARRLKRSADILWDIYETDANKMFEEEANILELENLEIGGVSMFISGLSIENLLKALLIKDNPNVVASGKLKQWPASGHDLIELAKEARISLDCAETALLKSLTTFVLWAGRYPVPKTVTRFRPEALPDGTHRIPGAFSAGDKRRLDCFFDRLVETLGISYSVADVD